MSIGGNSLAQLAAGSQPQLSAADLDMLQRSGALAQIMGGAGRGSGGLLGIPPSAAAPTAAPAMGARGGQDPLAQMLDSYQNAGFINDDDRAQAIQRYNALPALPAGTPTTNQTPGTDWRNA